MNSQGLRYAPVLRSDVAVAADAEQPGDRAAPNPLRLIHSLLRGRYIVTFLLAAVLMAGGAVVGYRATVPIYQSTGLIRIKPTVPSGQPGGQDSIMPAFEVFINSQVAFLRGERVTTKAMEDPAWQERRPGLSPQAMAAFRGSLDVGSTGGSEMVQVSFKDADPGVAMVAVKCVIKSYLELFGSAETEGSAERLTKLRVLRIEQSNLLRSKNASMATVAGTDFDPESLEKMYVHCLAELHKCEADWNEAQRLLAGNDTSPADKKPGRGSATQPALLTPEEIASVDGGMHQLLADRRAAQLALALARVRLMSAHPQVTEAQQKLAIIDADIEAYAERYEQSRALVVRDGEAVPQNPGELVLFGLRTKERNLRRLYDESAAKTKLLGQKVVSIQSLKREADAIKQMLDETNDAIRHLEFQASFGGRITTVSEGDRPLEPLLDKRKKLAGAGAFGGGALGVVLMLGIGLLNRRLVTVQDAHLAMHRFDRVLGVLPHVAGDGGDPDEAATAAHCVHHIRTLLQLEPGLPERRVFAITSPSPGDGKTTLAIALGMSFASCGARTLLLDCDMIGGGLSSKMDQMIRPKIGQVLRREGLVSDAQLDQALRLARQSGRRVGEVLVDLSFLSQEDVEHAADVQAQSYVGLLEVISGDPLGDCVTGTGRHGLFVLPLGSAGAHHAGQLSPGALQRVLAEARASYDVVIVDTGPILGSIEAALVSAQADGVVLTLSRGVPQALVKRSLDRLVELEAHVVGMVLNRAASRDVAGFAFSSSGTRSSRRFSSPQPVLGFETNLNTGGNADTSSAARGGR